MGVFFSFFEDRFCVYFVCRFAGKEGMRVK